MKREWGGTGKEGGRGGEEEQREAGVGKAREGE